MPTSRAHFIFSGFIASLIMARTVRGDQPPPPRFLRVDRVGETTYFHVRFDLPADLRAVAISPGPYAGAARRRLAETPMLVPQDGLTSAVYQRLDLPHFRPNVGFGEQEQWPPIKGLEFAGKLHGAGKARFLLLYPTTGKQKAPAGIQNKELAELLRPARWAEIPVELDFSGALPMPAKENVSLERLWAQAQATRLAILEALAPEHGFYGFACAATGRKYKVADLVLEGERLKAVEHIHRRMLDLTTGTMAITQSLALKRLRGGVRAPVQRTVDIAKVPGIAIAEHPWRQMMDKNKPAPEPLAGLVPHDNYYIHLKTFAKFVELQNFLEQWGTPASRAYEVHSRDHALKERYERQLCLKSTWAGRALGPLVIKSVAITGNDPYIREGSDVTVLFHVVNKQTFLAGVEQFIQEARKEFAGRLKESKELYHGTTIESFVTPLREVSTYRAAFGDFVVYSNSPVGLRRVIDTHQGREKSLSSSLDFQYMRTVFRADDKEEDGFAFLSDAFIRQFVGPASKVKEMRRLEALTSLSMLTHGALFTAWETGKLTAGHDALMQGARLKPEYLYVPEGKSVRWDAELQTAVSDAYNTLQFATPLVELPIDKITPFEEETYLEFRKVYLEMWRRFFDPVGIRFGMNKKQVKLEVYILPMINTPEYENLRQLTGGGITQLDPTRLSPRSLLQFTMSRAPNRWTEPLGDWAMIRLDDNRKLARLGEWWMRQELLPKDDARRDAEAAALILQLPITTGVGIKDKKEFPALRGVAKELVTRHLGPVQIKKSTYKDTTITRFEFDSKSELIWRMNKELAKGNITRVVVYEAVIEDGWYAGFDKQALKDLIDRAEERKKNKPAKTAPVDIDASWHMSPEAADQGGAALRHYLEWETHKRALPNDALWYILHRAKLVDAKTPERAKREAALKFLGFIPVSPDDAPYRYDAGKDEIVNQRHGSLRQPRLNATIADTSPLVELLGQFPSMRIDLRFREDGFHSVVTLQRKGP